MNAEMLIVVSGDEEALLEFHLTRQNHNKGIPGNHKAIVNISWAFTRPSSCFPDAFVVSGKRLWLWRMREWADGGKKSRNFGLEIPSWRAVETTAAGTFT